MAILKAIKERYSCRDYKPREIEEEKLNEIIEAARLAPSAHNEQPYRLVVAKSKEVREALGSACKQDFIARASLIVAGVSLESGEVMSSGASRSSVDVAIAMEHVALQATELGLGTCWVGAFDQQKAKEALSLSSDEAIIALMPLGYPADKQGERVRKDIDELVEIK